MKGDEKVSLFVHILQVICVIGAIWVVLGKIAAIAAVILLVAVVAGTFLVMSAR